MNNTLFPQASKSKQSFRDFLKPNVKCKSLSTVRGLVKEIDDYHNRKRHHSQKKKQPFVDRQQVRKAMKQKWKDPGYCNVQFSHYKALKGAFLNQWQIQRICLADRSFITPKDFEGYKFCGQSHEFPKIGKDMYSQKFQDYLTKIEEQNQTLCFNPRKLRTEPIVPTPQRTLLGKQKKTFQAFSGQNRPFGMGVVTWKKNGTKLRTTID